MAEGYYLIIAVLTGVLLVIALALLLLKMRRGEKFTPDYRAWFLIGLIWMVVGFVVSLSTDNPGYYGFTVMGLVFFALGLKNRDKWHERKSFADLTPAEQRIKLIGLGIAILLMLLSGVYFIWMLLSEGVV